MNLKYIALMFPFESVVAKYVTIGVTSPRYAFDWNDIFT